MADGSRDAFTPSSTPSKPSPHASASFLTTLDRVRSSLARTTHDETLLRDEAWPAVLKRIHGALDAGRPITGAGTGRGLPLDVVVQTLKAGWHVDGTWPVGPNAMQQLEEQSKQRAMADKGLEGKQDPSPDDVARAYRCRGVEVGEPEKRAEDDW